jgi:DNA-binding NtrC family response regulator
MVVLARGGVLAMRDLPAHLTAEPAAPLRHDESEGVHVVHGDATLHQLERVAVLHMLDHFHGNRTRAAEALGISVRTLQRRLKAWQPL